MRIINFTNRKVKTNNIVLPRNPRWWKGEIEPRVTHVLADDPEIIAAYAAKGIPEYKEEYDDEYNTKAAYNKTAIPDNWERLSWPEMRSLAARLAPSDTKIRNKEDALLVIRGVLEKED